MSVRRHALERSERQVRISSPLAWERRRAQLAYDALGEIEQQFHCPFSGSAGGIVAYSSVTVEFEVDFFDAPEQRDSALFEPHLTFGAYLAPGAETVMFSAAVNEWVTDDQRGAYTGAVVTVAACAPGATSTVAFEGRLHLTFQGFGAPKENVPELDVGT